MSNRSASLVITKIMLGASVVWTAGVLISLCLDLADKGTLDFAINVFELAYGLASGTLLLLYARSSTIKYAVIGTALAIFSWTLGQIYWFSFTLITGDILPYPSVGDMGYTGTYFLLIGTIGILDRETGGPFKVWYRFSSFLIMIVPCILILTGKNRIEADLYNFVLAAAVSFAFFKAFSLLHHKKLRFFTAGLFCSVLQMSFLWSGPAFSQTISRSHPIFYTCSLSPFCLTVY